MQPALDPPPTKHIGQHLYDWVNNCDLTQLDAIMLALFVLTVGCGTIGGLFVMGYVQNAINAGKGPPMVMQTVVTDRGPIQYRGFVVAPLPHLAPHMEPTAVAAMQAAQSISSRFGKPRSDTPAFAAEAAAAQSF